MIFLPQLQKVTMVINSSEYNGSKMDLFNLLHMCDIQNVKLHVHAQILRVYVSLPYVLKSCIY